VEAQEPKSQPLPVGPPIAADRFPKYILEGKKFERLVRILVYDS
jgi:hypothetical protein